MKLKQLSKREKQFAAMSADDFWYNLTLGGYIKPEELLESQEDIDKVNAAVKTLKDFQQSLVNLFDE